MQRLSKRVHDGLDTSVKNGTYCGGHLIYGYKLIDTDKRGNKGIIHRVAIDEEQAKVVRYIFTEYAHGTPKKEIVDFIAEMLKGNPADKEYQKQLIDNLVYKVFVYDDNIITYLTFGNEKDIKEISLADNDKAIDELKVQPLSSLVHHRRSTRL